MKNNPPLNKWTFRFAVYRDITRYDAFSRLFSLGLIKVHTIPVEGAMLQRKKHYKGFHFMLRFFWPFDVISWS